MNEADFNKLPEAQRKAVQQRLIDQGLYNGKPDGRFGGGTQTALKLAAEREAAKETADRANATVERANKIREEELAIKRIDAETAKGQAATSNSAQQLETARKQRYEDNATSGMGMAAQSAANLAAPAAGTALGMALGRGVNMGMDVAQRGRNDVLKGVAADRMAGRTTVDGARQGAKLAGSMPLSNPIARTASRMLPHVGLGALSIGKGAQILHESDPNGEFYPQMADRAAGLGYIGVGAGLAKQGLRYAAAPGVTPDAQSIAVINSNQLRPNGRPGALGQALSGQTIDLTADEVRPALPAPDAPAAAKAPTPGSKAYLAAQAKDMGLKVTTRMTKSQLADALTEAVTEHGAKRTVAKKGPKLPGVAGAGIAAALGYAATPDRAEAADGSAGPLASRAEALTNAGLAGGAAAGTEYGIGKLAKALGPLAGKALSAASPMSGLMSVSDMTDMTPHEINQGRNFIARNAPALVIGPEMNKAYDMAQTPQQAPEKLSEGPRADNGFHPAIQSRLERMVQLGAPPEAIASFLNQAAAR